MEQARAKNFVCKFCSKRFPCGKSLGGHIRTHMRVNSALSGEEAGVKLGASTNNGKISKRDSGSEAGLQSGYGLRENPKRTKRFADQTQTAFEQVLFCKECGKRFGSLKALCGHMASHSEKSTMDNQSDTETSSAPGRTGGSKRMKPGVLCGNNNSSSASFADYNSCNVSEIEREQEELAMCLMMLSRDSNFKKGSPNAWDDSGDNNSLILEAKSSCIDVRITIKNGVKCVSRADEVLEMKKGSKNNIFFSSSDNSDSGYFRNGPKRLETDDAFLEGGVFQEPNAEFGSGLRDMKAKSSKRWSKFKSLAEFKKNLVDNGEDGTSEEYDLRKTKQKPELWALSTQNRSENENNTSKCRESTSCGNALEAESYADLNPAMPENGNSGSSSSRNPGLSNRLRSRKKREVHQCPICSKVFKTGQALGGHKRSHFIRNMENNTAVVKQESTETSGFIDLNLPAPLD